MTRYAITKYACSTALVLSILSFGLAQAASAQDLKTTEQKREFLTQRVLVEVANPAVRADYLAKLEVMTPDQVDALLQHYNTQTALNRQRQQLALQQQQLAAQQQLAEAQALRNQLELEYRRQLLRRGGNNVGFAPVITTLPSGASLGAGAVISPDGRYVRVNAQPFFSQVGPVRTFNFANGQSGYYPGRGAYPQTIYPRTTVTTQPPRNPGLPIGYNPNPIGIPQTRTYGLNQVESYHDGLRTRVRPKRN